MKKAITLFLLLLSISAVSQPIRKGEHLILFRNTKNLRIKRIAEEANITVFIKNGKNIAGKIRKIRTDTIFYADTSIRAQDIDSIFVQAMGLYSDWKFHYQKVPFYVKGSPDLQIIFPPDSAIRNDYRFSVYVHGLTRKIRNEKLAVQNPLVYNNFLKWNLTKIAHLELGISYERIIAKNLSWETEVSGILGIPSSYFSMINYPVFNYNGISITTYPKYYYNTRTYVSLVLLYNYLSVDSMKCNWPRSGSATEFKSQRRNDYGISIRIWFMRRYGKTVIDYYVGGGIKFITTHDLVYGYYPEDSSHLHWIDRQGHSPKVYDRNFFGPIINFGIKIGGAF